jgi:hypothetical protein
MAKIFVGKSNEQMVDAWGGWSLFQELLKTLKNVALKHGVSVPTVAVRYILDQVSFCFQKRHSKTFFQSY